MEINPNSLDPTDKEIIRFLYRYNSEATTSQIAKKINLSVPATANRLEQLKEKDIVSKQSQGKIRYYKRKNPTTRKIETISAPPKIYWKLKIK